MIRVLLYLGLVCALAFGFVWLADRPGEVVITWLGHETVTSVNILVVAFLLAAVVGIVLWTVLRTLFQSPRLMTQAVRRRRHRKTLLAITRGLVAIGAGDARGAQRYARELQRVAPSEPLALLLRAQTAQISGDRAGAEATFRAMTERSETRLLGLHGLYVEARRRGDPEAARHFAEEAARTAPSLPWAGHAVLEFRCAEADWEGALAVLDANREHGLIDKATYQRHGAVLLTARALMLEDSDPGVAKMLASEATRFAPDLVPAAALAGRLLGETGDPRRAAKILQAAWRKHPHPDLADAYAHLRPEDSARDRLARVRTLVREPEDHPEGLLALSRAALDAREFALARQTLEPLVAKPTQRSALLMAEIEELEHGDVGRAREWVARAVRAARDPAWTADGFVSDRWLPVSPVTGRIDAFEWKVPVEEVAGSVPALEGHVDTRAVLPAGATPDRPIESAVPAVQPAKPASPANTADADATALEPATAAASQITAVNPPAGQQAQPVIPLQHAPDDPGPELGVEEAEPEAPPRSEGWRFGSLFR